jgi:microcystin-dependent protein
MAKATAAIFSTATLNTTMSPSTLGMTGGSQPHNNMMPYLTFYFNIALQGVYPPRS